MNLNKAIIAGRMTRDPEVKAIPSGMKVASFSVATNVTWKDKSGELKEKVEFHNIVVFGRQAESCGQYLKKGQLVLIEGRLQTRSWDNKEGVKQYRTEILADRVQFGPKSMKTDPDGADDSKDGIDEQPKKKGPISENRGNGKVADTGIEYPSEEINPDDIPF